jgi:hypothetical protein
MVSLISRQMKGAGHMPSQVSDKAYYDYQSELREVYVSYF